MEDRDITQYVEFSNWYEDTLLDRCICGATFHYMPLYNDRGNLSMCASCGRKIYITTEIKVWEVVEDGNVP